LDHIWEDAPRMSHGLTQLKMARAIGGLRRKSAELFDQLLLRATQTNEPELWLTRHAERFPNM